MYKGYKFKYMYVASTKMYCAELTNCDDLVVFQSLEFNQLKDLAELVIDEYLNDLAIKKTFVD